MGSILFRVDQWLALVNTVIGFRVPHNILNCLTS